MDPNLIPSLLAANTNRYRIINYDLPQLLPGSLNISSDMLIVLGLIVASFVVGILWANAFRLRDYGWKIGLILSTFLVSTFVVLFFDFRLGVDLKGGVILVYEVDERETKQLHAGRDAGWDMGQLISVINRRLNPTGLKEIVVRPFGPKQVEIVVPETDPTEIERIKETIRTAGVLQFMIVASDDRDTELFEAARTQFQRGGQYRMQREVLDAEGRQVGYWANLARDKGDEKTAPFRALEVIEKGYVRDARTGEPLELNSTQKLQFSQSQAAFDAFLKDRETVGIDVLLVVDPDFTLRGDDLAMAYPGHDESFRPAIHFTMKTEGALKMGHVTGENIRRKLAIVFDNALLSAPVIQSRIQDQGQITGNFQQEEVDFIVGILKSGSMPVVMQKFPISENRIGAILGLDTIRKGSWSVVIALGLVLGFMALYYRFSGLVACFALALNLMLTVAIVVLLKAPLTLPGLAGLVLTVAMSVDANVLISERMREELARGATLRMAIRNGFDKALSAIIDGNLTTFFTALVLYFIGTDQVKGFGLTLMLGNATSMFTAIFCARVILELGERTRWLKTLTMVSFLTKPRIDWVPFFAPAIAWSVILIVIGSVATVARGKGLFDIDLAGGTSVAFILKEPTPIETVREKLETAFADLKDPATNTSVDHNVYELSMENRPKGSVYKVDSSFEEVSLLQDKVRDALKLPDGTDGLKTFEMTVGTLEEVAADTPPPAPILSAPGAAASKSKSKPAEPAAKPAATNRGEKAADKAKEQRLTEPAEKKSDTKGATENSPPATEAKPPAESPEKSSGCGGDEQEEAAKTTQPPIADDQPAKTAEPKSEAPVTNAATPPSASATPAPGATATPTTETPRAAPKFRTKVQVRFPGSPISAAALQDRLNGSAVEIMQRTLDIETINPGWDGRDNSRFEEWTVILPLDKEQATKVLDHAKAQLEADVVWQTSSKIGGQVSANTRWQATGALALSMLGIIAYVWFRFQNVAWGLAAVAALAHDALVMMTGIAVSYWLAGPLGFLGIEEFKISLPVVAAFLAILGYSVNDTIVIFDRLREIRGRSPHVTRDMLNNAVNETLSRTIVLAGITLTVVLILYIFGGPGIHAFSFAMVIGVISGCYSTLMIASPLLLWMFSRGEARSSASVEPSGATKPAA